MFKDFFGSRLVLLNAKVVRSTISTVKMEVDPAIISTHTTTVEITGFRNSEFFIEHHPGKMPDDVFIAWYDRFNGIIACVILLRE